MALTQSDWCPSCVCFVFNFLQCCVNFCHTTRLSYGYTCAPSLPDLLPLPHPILQVVTEHTEMLGHTGVSVLHSKFSPVVYLTYNMVSIVEDIVL